ncbi:hypothetical protein RFI_00843, partial [Reticulomyxa filosa]
QLNQLAIHESENEIKETLDYVQEVKRFHKMPIIKVMLSNSSDVVNDIQIGYSMVKVEPFDRNKSRPKSHFKQCRNSRNAKCVSIVGCLITKQLNVVSNIQAIQYNVKAKLHHKQHHICLLQEGFRSKKKDIDYNFQKITEYIVIGGWTIILTMWVSVLYFKYNTIWLYIHEK